MERATGIEITPLALILQQFGPHSRHPSWRLHPGPGNWSRGNRRSLSGARYEAGPRRRDQGPARGVRARSRAAAVLAAVTAVGGLAELARSTDGRCSGALRGGRASRWRFRVFPACPRRSNARVRCSPGRKEHAVGSRDGFHRTAGPDRVDRASNACRRVATVPWTGPLIATAPVAAVGGGRMLEAGGTWPRGSGSCRDNCAQSSFQHLQRSPRIHEDLIEQVNFMF